MVLIRKSSFLFAKKIGFECQDAYVRTSHGAQYSISDADFIRMNRFIEKTCKVSKYR